MHTVSSLHHDTVHYPTLASLDVSVFAQRPSQSLYSTDEMGIEAHVSMIQLLNDAPRMSLVWLFPFHSQWSV